MQPRNVRVYTRADAELFKKDGFHLKTSSISSGFQFTNMFTPSAIRKRAVQVPPVILEWESVLPCVQQSAVTHDAPSVVPKTNANV